MPTAVTLPAPDEDPNDAPFEGDPAWPVLHPLSDADRDLFISVLDNPPPPTDALKRALAAARKLQP